jgi:hypothetical protein
MAQIGLEEEARAELRVSPAWEIQREVVPTCVTCQVLVEMVGGSYHRSLGEELSKLVVG